MVRDAPKDDDQFVELIPGEQWSPSGELPIGAIAKAWLDEFLEELAYLGRSGGVVG
jgi:hypothetical protein